jgi:hypothetical protein
MSTAAAAQASRGRLTDGRWTGATGESSQSGQGWRAFGMNEENTKAGARSAWVSACGCYTLHVHFEQTQLRAGCCGSAAAPRPACWQQTGPTA